MDHMKKKNLPCQALTKPKVHLLFSKGMILVQLLVERKGLVENWLAISVVRERSNPKVWVSSGNLKNQTKLSLHSVRTLVSFMAITDSGILKPLLHHESW